MSKSSVHMKNSVLSFFFKKKKKNLYSERAPSEISAAFVVEWLRHLLDTKYIDTSKDCQEGGRGSEPEGSLLIMH